MVEREVESPELPPGHSDEPPKGVFAMAIAILWGVLAFAFGFEAVVNFNNWLRPLGDTQDAIIAAVDLILCFALGVLAVILWKARDWLPRRVAESAIAVSTNPSVWVAVALVILIISALPQLRLPPEKAIPTADEIAKAVIRELPATVPSAPAAAPASSQVSAPPQSQRPSKVYSQSEKEDLRNAMRELLKIVDQQGHDVSLKIEDVLRAWDKMKDLSQGDEPLQKLTDLKASLSELRKRVDYQNGSIFKEYPSYSEEIQSILRLPKEWQADPIKNLWVVVDRTGQNIQTVEEVTKRGGQQLAMSVVELSTGITKFQSAQKGFLDWMTATKQRIADFRTGFL
jgi:hypothetical protein